RRTWRVSWQAPVVGRPPWSTRDARVPLPAQPGRQRKQADGGVGRGPGGPPGGPPHIARIQHRHRIAIRQPPSRFAVERSAQRPVARQQREVELVAVQQLAPGTLPRQQLAVIGPYRGTEEIAAPVEEDALPGIQAVNQVVGPLVAGEDARHGGRRRELPDVPFHRPHRKNRVREAGAGSGHHHRRGREPEPEADPRTVPVFLAPTPNRCAAGRGWRRATPDAPSSPPRPRPIRARPQSRRTARGGPNAGPEIPKTAPAGHQNGRLAAPAPPSPAAGGRRRSCPRSGCWETETPARAP